MSKRLEEPIDSYFQVALTSSVVVFAFDRNNILTYVVKRTEEPYKDILILPSVYIEPDMSNEIQVRKFISSKIETDEFYLEQLKAFAQVYRNPLGRVVNIGFYALIRLNERILDLSKSWNGKWVPISEVPELAFDHNEIVDYAKKRLKRRVKNRPVAFHLMPKEFTLTQLQRLYEEALNKTMDKRNFRKKVAKSELIVESGNITKTEETRKTAKLYSFDEQQFQKMTLKGYDLLF